MEELPSWGEILAAFFLAVFTYFGGALHGRTRERRRNDAKK